MITIDIYFLFFILRYIFFLSGVRVRSCHRPSFTVPPFEENPSPSTEPSGTKPECKKQYMLHSRSKLNCVFASLNFLRPWSLCRYRMPLACTINMIHLFNRSLFSKSLLAVFRSNIKLKRGYCRILLYCRYQREPASRRTGETENTVRDDAYGSGTTQQVRTVSIW